MPCLNCTWNSEECHDRHPVGRLVIPPCLRPVIQLQRFGSVWKLGRMQCAGLKISQVLKKLLGEKREVGVEAKLVEWTLGMYMCGRVVGGKKACQQDMNPAGVAWSQPHCLHSLPMPWLRHYSVDPSVSGSPGACFTDQFHISSPAWGSISASHIPILPIICLFYST